MIAVVPVGAISAAILLAVAGLFLARPRPRFGNFIRRFGKAFLDEPNADYRQVFFLVRRGRALEVSGVVPPCRFFAFTLYTLRRRVVAEFTDRDLGLRPGDRYRFVVTSAVVPTTDAAVVRIQPGAYFAIVRTYLAPADAPGPRARYLRGML